MVEDYKPYLRYGLASGTGKDGGKWRAGVDDNDGLWTSLFAVGELMRYDSLKQLKFNATQIQIARQSALTSLKAVLMISNIACRNKTIQSRLRYLNNTRAGRGNAFNSNYLKEDKTYAFNNYPGSAADGEGLYGMDAGKVIDGHFFQMILEQIIDKIISHPKAQIRQCFFHKRHALSLVEKDISLMKYSYQKLMDDEYFHKSQTLTAVGVFYLFQVFWFLIFLIEKWFH